MRISTRSSKLALKQVDIFLNNLNAKSLVPEIKKQITAFQDSQIEKEFAKAVEEHRIEEVYWVGGEPLMYEQHWQYMKRIIDLGDGDKSLCKVQH